MKTRYNDFLEPRYEFNTQETKTLNANDFVITDDCERCLVKVNGTYILFKRDDNYTSIKLNCEEE